MPLDLQLPLTSFVGRAREMDEAQRLLAPAFAGEVPVRLLTLTGPGGVGKTRLALQLAHALHASFSDDIHFVSLAAIANPTLVVPTILQALGCKESPERLPLKMLSEAIGAKCLLLILDNFEQLLPAAPLLVDLLGQCTNLRVLATSREALHVRGEQEFPLAPLALPDLVTTTEPSPEVLLQYPGVALFVQRAQARLPSFALSMQNAAAVAELCAHLDGLPLAIELAAARVKLLSPHAMLARLRSEPQYSSALLDYLSSGARDAPARQRTLRGTIRWSYDLLHADEQRAFRLLSVFVGGCTFDAATEMLNEAAGGQNSAVSSQRSAISEPQLKVDGEPSPVLDTLASLVDKNLLRQSETTGEPRLSMLETMREFAAELLAGAGEAVAARRAHAAYFLAHAENAARELAGTEQIAGLSRLDAEHANLRAALDWALQQREAETALRLSGALARYWFLRGHWSEGRRRMEEALALDPGGSAFPALWAHLAHEAGRVIRYQGDLDRAQALDTQSLAIYRSLNDQSGMLLCLIQLARLSNDRAQWAEARLRVDEALALLPAISDPRARAETLFIAGTNALLELDLEPAQARLQESLRLMRALGDKAGIAAALNALGYVETDQGDYAAAQAILRESSTLAAEIGDQRSTSRALFALARLATRMGDYPLARTRFAELLPLMGQLQDYNVVWLWTELAYVLLQQGMPRWAVRVASMSAHLRATRNIPLVVMFQSLIEQVETATRAALTEAAYAEAWAEGRTLSGDELMAIPNPPAHNAPPGLELTARELEVLQLLVQDLNAPAIAERLVVSPRTVHAHLRSIYDKLGVNSRDAAVRYATERGLV